MGDTVFGALSHGFVGLFTRSISQFQTASDTRFHHQTLLDTLSISTYDRIDGMLHLEGNYAAG